MAVQLESKQVDTLYMLTNRNGSALSCANKFSPGDLLRALSSRWKRRWVVLDTNTSDMSGGRSYSTETRIVRRTPEWELQKPPLQRIFQELRFFQGQECIHLVIALS